MPTRHAVKTAAAFVLIAGLAQPLLAQPLKPSQESKFQTAQRNINQAIFNLEAFLKASPNSKDAPAARIQLKGLQNLAVSQMSIEPVDMSTGKSTGSYMGITRGDTEWYVETVERQEERTRVTLLIRNKNEQEERAMYALDSSPLILIDNKGEYYPVIEKPVPPEGIREETSSGGSYPPRWILQGGRAIRVDVFFAPLAPGAVGGKILYKDGNVAVPAKFSLLNKKQQPKP